MSDPEIEPKPKRALKDILADMTNAAKTLVEKERAAKAARVERIRVQELEDTARREERVAQEALWAIQDEFANFYRRS